MFREPPKVPMTASMNLSVTSQKKEESMKKEESKISAGS
jgi:hypothetical protein